MKPISHEDTIEELKAIRNSIDSAKRWIITSIILAALIIGAALSPDTSIRDGIGGTLIFLTVIGVLIIALGHSIASLSNWQRKRSYDKERIAVLSGRTTKPSKRPAQ